MKRINNLIKSEVAALMLLSLALVAQMPHAAMVFHRLADLPLNAGRMESASAWLHATTYALALELATLFFVIRGKRRIAYVFAVASVLINLAYYETWTRNPWEVMQIALVSLILPVAIAMYSHDAAESIAATGNHDSGAEKRKTATSPRGKRKTVKRQKKQVATDEAETKEVELQLVADVNLQPDIMQRRKQLATLLQVQPDMSQNKLAQEVGVSRPTVAKDIAAIEAEPELYMNGVQ